MTEKNEKIQIVAFSTKEKDPSPNDIFEAFLEKYTHSMQKKSSRAMAFSMTLTDEEKPKNIMICSIIDLTVEYTGITEVNCYILFIDLENEDSNEKLESIESYIQQYCQLDKKLFIFGMVSGNEGTEKCLTREDILKSLDIEDNNFEYKEINLSQLKEYSNDFMDILIYSSKHPIGENSKRNTYHDKGDDEGKSCEIY